jgi:hypothetical protein
MRFNLAHVSYMPANPIQIYWLPCGVKVALFYTEFFPISFLFFFYLKPDIRLRLYLGCSLSLREDQVSRPQISGKVIDLHIPVFVCLIIKRNREHCKWNCSKHHKNVMPYL